MAEQMKRGRFPNLHGGSYLSPVERIRPLVNGVPEALQGELCLRPSKKVEIVKRSTDGLTLPAQSDTYSLFFADPFTKGSGDFLPRSPSASCLRWCTGSSSGPPPNRNGLYVKLVRFFFLTELMVRHRDEEKVEGVAPAPQLARSIEGRQRFIPLAGR